MYKDKITYNPIPVIIGFLAQLESKDPQLYEGKNEIFKYDNNNKDLNRCLDLYYNTKGKNFLNYKYIEYAKELEPSFFYISTPQLFTKIEIAFKYQPFKNICEIYH